MQVGGSIEINKRLSYIAIKRSDGAEFFIQGEEANSMLSELTSENPNGTPEWINAEYWWLAQSLDR